MTLYEANFEKIYSKLNVPEEEVKKPTYEDIESIVCTYTDDIQALAELAKVFFFTNFHHAGAKRDNGDDYISHPINVAIELAKMHADWRVVAAGIMHDLNEDTVVSYDEIGTIFGKEIADIVKAVSNFELIESYDENGKVQHTKKKYSKARYMRELILGTRDDMRIMVVKLADKLHNMRTLQYKTNPQKRVTTALNTLSIFSPLAGILGMNKIKRELEDLSFKHINPTYYEIINEVINEELSLRKNEIFELYKDIDNELNDLSIEHSLKLSTKNIYGIYKDIIHNLPVEEVTDNADAVLVNQETSRKYYDATKAMIKETIKNKNIHDLISMQVIVHDEVDCFVANRHICESHQVAEIYTKDYIRNPRPNMYRSLHTTVFDKKSKMVELQIRTEDMDKVADYGFAACWDLDAASARLIMQEGIKINYSKPVHAIDTIYKNDDDKFLEMIMQEVFAENNIVVYAPNGRPFSLPFGSTAIDFAYLIHSEVGNKMEYVLVNNKKHNRNYVLHDHDCVEVVLNEDKKDLADISWLKYTVTTLAKKRIMKCVNNRNANKIEIEPEKVKTKRMS